MGARRTRLCIVGGALQGMEAVFLGHEAGYETVVIDRRPDAPALSICDEPHVLNPLTDVKEALMVFSTCDAVIPACEELDLLEALDDMLGGSGIPFLFDLDSYDVSCSKNLSNEVMASVDVPLPGRWPECGFPVIVKPSCQSGSIGVSVAFTQEDVDRGLRTVEELGDQPVIQEFVHGKSVSIEVIGDGETARSFVTTEVVLDTNYDCKMVRCFPDILTPEQEEEFRGIGKRVAEAIGLSALMDVEAILTPKGLRVLEIDARIPSQTPAAIYIATGINLLEELVTTALGDPKGREGSGGSGIYWHLHFKDGVLRTTGEKEFGKVRKPIMGSGLFGSDRYISDYHPGCREWHGTFMVSGGTPEEAELRRLQVLDNIKRECDIVEYNDGTPEVI